MNQENWNRWIELHLDKLLLYCRWQSRNEEDARDILYWVLKIHAEDFAAIDDDEFYLFLCRRLKLRAIDFYRSLERRKSREKKYGELNLVNSEVRDQSGWFENYIEAKESQKMLLQELSNIDDNLQEVVVLHIWNELSFRQIAELLDLAKSTVMSRYQKAMAELKKRIERETDEQLERFRG